MKKTTSDILMKFAFTFAGIAGISVVLLIGALAMDIKAIKHQLAVPQNKVVTTQRTDNSQAAATVRIQDNNEATQRVDIR